MRTFFRHILCRPRTVLILLAIPTALFASFLPRLKKETDVTNMLPAGHPSVSFSKEIEETFDIKEGMLIGVLRDTPQGIYDERTLQFLYRLTERLMDLEGIRPDSVKSLFTVDDIIGTPDGFIVAPLLPAVPETGPGIRALQRRIAANRLLQGELVSRDGKGALIHAEPEPGADQADLYHRVLELIASEKVDPELEVFVAGTPVVRGVIGIYVEEDLSRMLPLVGAVVAGMLALFLRSIRGVFLPLLVVLFSVTWTMGCMAMFGIPIYPMTTIVPIIIMALGCADGIHVLSRFYEATKEGTGLERRGIILLTMDEMWRPVVMTSLTTTVGFLSLLSSDMEPLRYLGIFSSFGVTVAMVFSLTFLPACLAFLGLPRRPARSDTVALDPRGDGTLQGSSLLRAFGAATYAHRKAVLLSGLLLVVLSIVSLSLLRVDADPMRYFNPDTEIPRADRRINEHFNGTGLLCVVLDGGGPDAFKSPELLRRLEALEQALEGMDDVGGCLSLADYLKKMNRAMHGDDPNAETLPDTRAQVAQYLLLYSLSGDPEDLERVVDDTFQKANLIIRVRSLSSARVGRVLREVRRVADSLCSDGRVSYRIGGRAEVIYVVVNLIVKGQIQSLLLSAIGVFLITTGMFRSWRDGLLNVVPISVASIMNLGVMGLLGLPLEPGSAITSCIGIGVGIDYSIHFLSKYRYLATHLAGPCAPGQDESLLRQELICRTMETAGKAIAYNALVVMLGFLVLLFSHFPPSRDMGILVSLNMFTCFLGALTLLPALLGLIRPPWAATRSTGHDTTVVHEGRTDTPRAAGSGNTGAGAMWCGFRKDPPRDKLGTKRKEFEMLSGSRKVLVLWACLASFGALGTGEPRAPEPVDLAQEYWNRGEALYQTHHLGPDRFEKALEWYEKAVALCPNRYEYLWKLSKRYQILGQALGDDQKERKLRLWQRGVEYGRRAVEVNPNGKEGHFYYMANMGAIAKAKGMLSAFWKFRKIKKELDRTLELDPNFPPALFARAQYLTEMPALFGGDENEAMRLYRRVLELDPGYLLAYVCMARIEAKRGRYDEAIAHLRKVLDCKSPPHIANYLTIDRPRAEALLREIQEKGAKESRMRNMGSRRGRCLRVHEIPPPADATI